MVKYPVPLNNPLTFTTLYANSADDKLIFFLFSLENRIWHLMQIVSTGDNLHETSKSVSWKLKIRKYLNLLSVENFTWSAYC